jgi:nucleoside-diphosphate-sugar epimerase
MKIAIVGGMGYIGSALRELYRNSEHEVTIIDKDLNLHRISMLPNNFKFIHKDITKEILDMSEYDIVYNLAGITLTYSTNEEEVMGVNYHSAVNLAQMSARYIFPSTNNMFGGYGEQLYDVKEDKKPEPIGIYANSKYEVEKWLKENHNNYVICRLGSNYGYSDGLKWSPVINTFILNTIFKKPILLDKGCDNIRPFVNVNDSARALYHVAHHDKIKNDIFHVVSRNDSLRNIANKIKEVDDSVVIEESGKENWFNGYEINGDKLKRKGFDYMWKLTTGYKIMRGRFKNVVR